MLLDLGRMNRIVDFSEELGYVTVEPGVTQAQLQAFLAERGSRLWMDSTGASPECSLIGNTVERGFGHTPYGDHFAHSCGLEVVLPDGAVIETGLARYPSAHAAPTYRWGVGPFLDGLFSQSNFGVVTRMTIWLMPAPEYFQAYYFRCERDGDLPAVIDGLRPLRMSGTIRSASHIANDYKVVSALEQYPWERNRRQNAAGRSADGPIASRVEDRGVERLRRALWHEEAGGRSTAAGAESAARKRHPASVSGRPAAARWPPGFSGLFGLLARWDISRALELVRPVYGLMKGAPTDQPLKSAYWRKRTPPPAQMNPDRDRCGLLWLSPVAPAEGRHALAMTEISSRIMLNYGFEPLLSLTLITERALICVISITFDRDQPGEDERALSCYEQLRQELTEKGYIPYRLGIQSMVGLRTGGAYERFVEGIKHLADPAGILAPGRYGLGLRAGSSSSGLRSVEL